MAHLELFLSLDTNQNGRTSLSDNNLIWEVNTLENESESAFELFDDSLDQAGESDLLALGRVPKVLQQLDNDFCVGFTLKSVAAFFEDNAKLLVYAVNSCQLCA